MRSARPVIEEWKTRVDELNALYKEKGRRGLMPILDVSYGNVQVILKALGIVEKRSLAEFWKQKQEEPKCIRYHENGWTERLAYFVGYFLGDGTIREGASYHRTGLRQIQVPSVEIEPLQAFSEMFGFPIHRNAKLTQGGKVMYYIQNTDRSLCQWLIDLGFVPAKSKVGMHLPKVPNEYFYDFLRGLIDSDGSIVSRPTNNGGYSLEVIVQGHPSYIWELCTRIGGYQFSPHVLPSKSGQLAKLAFHKLEEAPYLYEDLYTNCTVCISRKRRMFERALYCRKRMSEDWNRYVLELQRTKFVSEPIQQPA